MWNESATPRHAVAVAICCIRTAIEEWTTARELVSIARKRFELNQDRVTELEKRAKVGQAVEIELRKAFEASDFAVGSVTEEHLAKEKAWREENQKPIGR